MKIQSAPLRARLKLREFEKYQIDKVVFEGFIEPTQTKCTATIVFAPEKDGSFRFCVDDRKLYAVTKRHVYQIQNMDESIDSLGEAAVLSTLGAYCRY